MIFRDNSKPATRAGSSTLQQDVADFARSSDRTEFITLAVILCLFLTLGLCIQSRYIPWSDEVQFVDPAANLYFHAGFVSTQWSNQTDRTFWSGNAPAYPVLLYLAFRTFHFSQTVARCLNYVITALAVFSLWLAVRRLRLFSHWYTRLLIVLLVLTAASCYPLYANIRYDCLSFLECSLVLLSYTLSRWRRTALFVLGIMMPLTNLQLPLYAVILALLISWNFALRFQLIERLLSLFIGIAAGAGLLFLLYALHPGAWTAFLITLSQQAGQSLPEKLRDLHQYFEYDPSLLSVFVLLLAGFVAFRSRLNSRSRQALITGLLICTVLPVLFFLTRRFVFSSAWIVYIPAVLCLGLVIESKISTSYAWRMFTVVCCAASIGFGLPKKTMGILNDWQVRNYAVVDAFVSGSVRLDDIVFSDSEAYFALKPKIGHIYGPGYPLSPAEKNSMTLAIVEPANETRIIQDLGGRWIATSQLVRDSKSNAERLLPIPTNFSCRLVVLRRAYLENTIGP